MKPKYSYVGWVSIGGFHIVLLFANTPSSELLSTIAPPSTTGNSPTPSSHVKVSTNKFCLGGICKLGRRGSSLDKNSVIVGKLLSNFVIHDSMVDTLSITHTCVF